MISENAKTSSQGWARYLEKNLAEVESIIGGARPSPEIINFIRYSREIGNVHRFKLFDRAGRLVLDSDKFGQTVAGGNSLGTHNAKALAAITSNEPYVAIEEKQLQQGRRLLAEIYFPLSRNAQIAGVTEVYFDQTENVANFRQTFAWTSMVIAGLSALGFALPGFGFYWRTLQKLRADQHIQFLGNHDALTALPNRIQLSDVLARRLNDAESNKTMTAVHFVDLDFFKDINHQHGHGFGDELLRAIAGRLKDSVRSGDIVSRFGGDEFVIAQFGFSADEQIGTASDRIDAALKAPFQFPGRNITITASIGTAVSPRDGMTPEQLVKHADIALYVVKARGRNDHCWFEPVFEEEYRKRLKLEGIISNAVANRSFELYFQPLYTCQSAEINGFEALLRLKDEEGQFIPPAQFIPVAEELGLIDDLGAWVLDSACAIAAAWPAHLQVSVNLSAVQFRRQSVCASTRAALAKSCLAPQRLLLEITEGVRLSDADTVLAQLKELKGLGVSIVIDDFGSGYSSLGYMLKFPFDRIKIDRDFIKALESGGENAHSLVQSIIALGHTMKMTVTAEGVETVAQANALRDMKCDDVQGYLFGRPMPETEIAALILKRFARGIATPAADVTTLCEIA